MKTTTKFLMLILLMIGSAVYAQQQCAVMCHNGSSIKVFNVNAINGHLGHGDILISTDCNYEPTGNECNELTVPSFSFTREYPLGIDYEVYDITGRILQKGKTFENMQKSLPKTQILLFKVTGYKITKLIL